jgi:ATP-dependent DNA helicase RecG
MIGENYTSLIIGDVGSGKTYVAICSALAYLANSIETKVVMVAPTEVLAFQHYQSLQKIIESNKITDIELIYLTAKTKFQNNQKVSKIKYKELQNKKVFVIGTHSVFNIDEIKFDLVMVDEQHRFGVNQRGIFSEYPHHFLSFTATPIPRTLALSLFSKLNTQFLERLDGRVKIKSYIYPFEKIFSNQFYTFLTDNYLQKGKKIYVVCPKIDIKDSEDKIYAVEEVFEIFNKEFPNKVLSLTGKDKAKKDILEDFKSSNEKQILVSTSVIEVGVDIKEAECIIILNSERFGLAALHQLRGRVGRNNENTNLCILAVEEKFLKIKRLQILVETEDGFKIADEDMKNRGYGDISGKIQSGFTEEIDLLTRANEEDLSLITRISKDLDLNKLPRLKNYVNNRLINYHGE